MASFTVTPPVDKENHRFVDANLKARITVTAGPHDLGVTFLKNPSSLLETKRQPYQAHFNMHRHPRISPAVYQISITGPYEAKGTSETASRRRSLHQSSAGPAEENDVPGRFFARSCVAPIAGRSTDDDLKVPMKFYRSGPKNGRFRSWHRKGPVFDSGESAVPVSHRARSARRRAEHGLSHQRSGTGLAAVVLPLEQHSRRRIARRWPSANELSKPDVLEQQVRRMLADRRARKPRDQFCRPMAVSAQSGDRHPRPAAVPRFRRQPAASVSPGNRTVLRAASCAKTAACSIC